MTRVIDASALVDAVLPTARQDAALAALSDHELWAPAIVDLEVASAVHRLERAGTLATPEADRAIELLRAAPIRRMHHDRLVALAWELRPALRVSDAFYVAAARLLRAELVTSDARLSRAPGLGVSVLLLG
ncbi:MAG: type II toxin-antitoxin system VapC family toxin [Cellulomonadaceae bacterium]